MSKTVAYGFHVQTVFITAHSHPYDSLREVTAHIEPEFAPYFLTNIICYAIAKTRVLKKLADGLNSVA